LQVKKDLCAGSVYQLHAGNCSIWSSPSLYGNLFIITCYYLLLIYPCLLLFLTFCSLTLTHGTTNS
jgi:hypothetical protein